MAKRVTVNDIRQMNDIYYVCKSYAEVARQTGWSASTVAKYVDKEYQPIVLANIKRFNLETDMPEFSTEMFEGVENWGDLCVMTEEEEVGIKELWKELEI